MHKTFVKEKDAPYELYLIHQFALYRWASSLLHATPESGNLPCVGGFLHKGADITMVKRFLPWLQAFFLGLAFLLVALLLYSQRDELWRHEWRFEPRWLTLSALFMLASWATEIAVWRNLLGLVARPLPYLPAARIWFCSAIVRYIPGNVWQPLSMTLYCQQWGIRPEATLTSVALYMSFTLLASAPIAATYFFATGNFGLLTTLLTDLTPWLLLLGIVPLAAFLLRPQWLIAMINWGLHLIGRPTLNTSISARRLLGLLLATVITWLLWGASFATLTFALGGHSADEMRALTPHLIAVFPIAYAIGFLSLLTPSGFGVREGALYLLLAPLVDGGLVAVAALTSRIWIIVGELVMAGISLLLPAMPPTASHLANVLDGEPSTPILET